jgi:hypothetical protein
MRRSLVLLALLLIIRSGALAAQATGKFPPDSATNLQVIPKGTPVREVLGTMRTIAGALGVRCVFCHVGEEGKPLSEFNFASDDKPTKLTARQMMLMVAEVNRRLDTLPMHEMDSSSMPHVEVTCRTCHRGVELPMPLSTLIAQVTIDAGADSAVRAYHALRDKYYGRDAYDFGEGSLNMAAFQVARRQKLDEALALLTLNEQQFPGSSGVDVARGNVFLVRGDTAAAAAAYREAVKRDSTNGEARARLRDIGQTP